MKGLKIEIPEDHIIDLEKSDLSKGIIAFKNIERSKDWQEFCINNTITNDESYIGSCSIVSSLGHVERNYLHDKNAIPSKKLAEAFLALMQLLTIRHKEYTKGWEYDFKGDQGGYCIVNYANEIQLNHIYYINSPLTFPNEEMSREFLNTWKELIEIAKPLL